tara:strand:+ start:616 stop:831 length:216 start_codon:yes stop_codon:yes gene_type:complete
MTPQEQLAAIISQILDDNTGQIFDINLHSPVGRQMIADIIARQMIDDPNMVVIDTLNDPQTWFDGSITNLN